MKVRRREEEGERVGGHICERAREEDRYEDALLLSRSLGSSRL